MGQPIIIGAVLAYAGLLFLIAWYFDKRAKPERGPASAALIYALSIAVYCTSWTFYGAVGTAQTRGWEYLPIYLGPILIFSLGRSLLTRLVETGKRINTTSIADFISAHYQKSRAIAALVTAIAVIGALPYIALQLKSVATTFDYIAHEHIQHIIHIAAPDSAPPGGNVNTTLLVAIILALFAIMFGTRNIDITRPNRGMIAAIAFDSIIKLAALVAVGLFAISIGSGGATTPADLPTMFAAEMSADRFIVLTLLSMAAILCLPRQFHVTVVECRDPKQLSGASNVFLIYLALISVLVIPIAGAGASSSLLAGVPPDLTVLALPMIHGADLLALFVFVGGFAAATAMVIVASVALSTMITNDLVAPVMLRTAPPGATPPDFGRQLLLIRRLSILALLASAALVAAYAPQGEQLASFGILSFAAVAQFMPALLGALYWKNTRPLAAFWGMAAGFILWLLTLVAPSYGGAWAQGFLVLTAWLDPLGWDLLTEGVIVSVGANALIYIALSQLRGESAQRDLGYRIFPSESASGRTDQVRAGDLYLLIQRCLGEEEGRKIILAFESERNRAPDPTRIAGPGLIDFTDQQISKAIGASSARILLQSVLSGRALVVDDVATLLSETSDKMQFSQEILQATLENTSHGVAVVDAALRLVAWNKPYVDMYGYPDELIQDGRPIADLIRFNAERGEFRSEDIEGEVQRRLAHLRAAKRHSFERTRPNGMVVRIEGVHSPGGLYVTTFTDVTDYKLVEKALIESERSIRFYTDNMPAMASFIDGKQVFRFANSAYRDVFGLREHDIGRRTIKDLLSAEDYALRAPYIEAAFAGERVTFDIELTIEGARKFMQVAYVPQWTPDGSVRGFFGIYQDVTARREAELEVARTNESLEERVEDRTRELVDLNEQLDAARKQAEEATASKTRFLAAASHDVLQPLNAARLFVSALKDSSAADEQIAELSDKIDASIGTADRLLRALLNISKLDAGGIEPDIKPFSLDELFDDIANDFSLAASSKGLALRRVKSGLWVRSDRGLLLSAIQNLVANAIRYTDKGKILLGARRMGDELRIDVYDTGRGIPDHRRQEIFQEFKRLDRDREVAGAGLGLATVDRVARLLESTLTVRSTEGKGSRFSITATRCAAIDRAPQTPRARARGEFHGKRVLCIDNDLLVREGTKAALTRWGAEVGVYPSDMDALSDGDSWRTPPDFLLLDYQLDDGRTGFDALAALERVWGTRPQTIMITASHSGDSEARAERLGIPVLAKPIEPAELRALINQLMKQAAE